MSLKKCCVIICSNTSENSPYGFYSFPTAQFRFRRARWIRAVRKTNGRRWKPIGQSFVCGAHFVNGEPSLYRNYENYVPTINLTKKDSEEYWSPKVSVKRYAEEYIKYDALAERPNKKNSQNEHRKRAYSLLAKGLGINVATARSWERRFRSYIENKIAMLNRRKTELPDWIAEVEERLQVTKHLQTKPKKLRVESPRDVVRLLCEAASRHGALCSSQLYHDVRRALRINNTVGISGLHVVWVGAQRVAISQVCAAGRGGDRPGPAPDAARVADLVLLHTDLHAHHLLNNESVELFEESVALHELWRLVQRHQLEEPLPRNCRQRDLRWSRAHRDYLQSGRVASIVVLQRRWHELKLQARERLAAHWRRATAGEDPTGPAAQDPGAFTSQHPETTGGQDPGIIGQDSGITAAQDPGTPVQPAPPPPPPPPRPALLHLAILKRYPHIARSAPASWHQLVLDGLIVTEPLESDMLDDDAQSEVTDVIDNAEEDTPASGDVTSDDDASHTQYPLYTDPEADVVKAEESGSEDDDHLVIDEPDCFSDPLHIYKNAHKHTEYTTHTEPATNTDNTDIYDTHIDEPAVPAESSAVPTLQVFSLMDPTSLKTELIFESDDEPCAQDNKVEIPLIVKQEDIRNRLVFDDDDDGTGNSGESDVDKKGDIIVKSDVTGKDEEIGKSEIIGNDGLDGNNEAANSEVDSDRVMEQQGAEANNPLVFDPKILLESRVELVKLDEIPAWKKYAQNKTIEVFRIIEELPAPRKRHLDEIKIEKCSEIVSNELLLKRELQDNNTVELEVPAKMARADTDSEGEEPLASIRVKKSRHNYVDDEYKPKSKTRRKSKRDSDTDSSGEGQNDLLQEIPEEQYSGKRGADSKRFKSAASTVAWSSRFPEVYGAGRGGPGGAQREPGGAQREPGGPSAAKRVRLPDIADVRRVNSGILTAQVAPITAPLQSESASSVEDIAETEVTETWCDDNMPPPHKLDTVLAELTSECATLEAAHCCAARRHLVVNDTRRRMRLPAIALHKHADGVCACCCAQLCDEAASSRARLAAQLDALHTDICHMLRMSAVVVEKKKKPKGKEIHKKKDSSVSEARSPSPTSMFSMVGTSASYDNFTNDTKSITQITQSTAQPSQAMIKAVAPLVKTSTTATPSTSAEPTILKSLLKSKKKSSSCKPSASAKADGYDEWMRQKSLYSKYFIMPTQVTANKHSTSRAAAPAPNILSPNVLTPNVPPPNVPVTYVLAPNVPSTNVPPPNVLTLNVPTPNVLTPVIPASNIPTPAPPSSAFSSLSISNTSQTSTFTITNSKILGLGPNGTTIFLNQFQPLFKNSQNSTALLVNTSQENTNTTLPIQLLPQNDSRKTLPKLIIAQKVPQNTLQSQTTDANSGKNNVILLSTPNVSSKHSTSSTPSPCATPVVTVSTLPRNPLNTEAPPTSGTAVSVSKPPPWVSPNIARDPPPLLALLASSKNPPDVVPSTVSAPVPPPVASTPIIIEVPAAQSPTKTDEETDSPSEEKVDTQNKATSARHKGIPHFVRIAPKISRRYPLSMEGASGTDNNAVTGVSETKDSLIIEVPAATDETARLTDTDKSENPSVLQNMYVTAAPSGGETPPSRDVSLHVPPARGSRVHCVVTVSLPLTGNPPTDPPAPVQTIDLTSDDEVTETTQQDKIESRPSPDAPEGSRTESQSSIDTTQVSASSPSSSALVADDSETDSYNVTTDELIESIVEASNINIKELYVYKKSADVCSAARVRCGAVVVRVDAAAPPLSASAAAGAGAAPPLSASAAAGAGAAPPLSASAAAGAGAAPPLSASAAAGAGAAPPLSASAAAGAGAAPPLSASAAAGAGAAPPLSASAAAGAGAAPPLSASAAAGAGAAPHARLVVTRRRLPQRYSTYWTLAPLAAAERLLAPHDRRLSPAQQAAQADCDCGHSQHRIEVLSAVRTVKQLRELTSQGAPLFLLSKRSGQYHPLRPAPKNQDTG